MDRNVWFVRPSTDLRHICRDINYGWALRTWCQWIVLQSFSSVLTYIFAESAAIKKIRLIYVTAHFFCGHCIWYVCYLISLLWWVHYWLVYWFGSVNNVDKSWLSATGSWLSGVNQHNWASTARCQHCCQFCLNDENTSLSFWLGCVNNTT